MFFHRPLVNVVLLFSLGFILACSAGPSDPIINASRTDTARHTLIITPDSGSAKIGAKIDFTLTANPALPKTYTIAWMIDAEAFTRSKVDTISHIFTTLGKHALKAVYIDSTGSRRDSAATIVAVTDTTTPNVTGLGGFSIIVDNETLDRSQYHDACRASTLFSPSGSGMYYFAMDLTFARQLGYKPIRIGLSGHFVAPTTGSFPIVDFHKTGGILVTLDSADNQFASLDGGTLTITKFDTLTNLISGTFHATLARHFPTEDTSFKKSISGTFSEVGITERMFAQGSMSAAISGVPFQAVDRYGNNISASREPSGQVLSLIAEEVSDTATLSIFLYINTPRVGSFVFGDDQTAGTAWCDVTIPHTTANTTGRTNCGTLNITQFDSVNRRLSGTFSVTPVAVDSSGSIPVTNGVLDNVTWVQE